MIIKGDFHVHTNYCPHGSKDTMEQYVEQALKKGLTHLSFTEHAPLPKNFKDPVPEQDSAMRWSDIDNYFADAAYLKEKYQADININLGFEVDYIIGYEAETRKLLNEWGEQIDDAILSVHMLKTPQENYVCLDYSAEEFGRITKQFGSVDKVYQNYYQTLAEAVTADLGPYKPKRIGHITLIEKFQKRYKPEQSYQENIHHLLQLIKQQQYQLDVNTAGLFKEHCQSLYPDIPILQYADQLGIPLVPGSDSHVSATIQRGFENLPADLSYTIPV